jgi:hypothetical protein
LTQSTKIEKAIKSLTKEHTKEDESGSEGQNLCLELTDSYLIGQRIRFKNGANVCKVDEDETIADYHDTCDTHSTNT